MRICGFNRLPLKAPVGLLRSFTYFQFFMDFHFSVSTQSNLGRHHCCPLSVSLEKNKSESIKWCVPSSEKKKKSMGTFSLLGTCREAQLDASWEMVQMAYLASPTCIDQRCICSHDFVCIVTIYLGSCSHLTSERVKREWSILLLGSEGTGMFAFPSTCKIFISCSIGKHLVMLSRGSRRSMQCAKFKRHCQMS